MGMVAVGVLLILGNYQGPVDPMNGYFDYIEAAKLAKSAPGGAVLAAIRAGNGKACRDPRETYRIDTLFPELSSWKTLADRVAKEAETDSAKRGQWTLEGLRYSRALPQSTWLPVLVSFSVRLKLDRVARTHLHRLSEAELKALDASLGQPIQAGDLRAVIVKERQMVSAGPAHLVQSGELKSILRDQPNEPAAKLFASWDEKEMNSPENAQHFLELGKAFYSHLYSTSFQALLQPERTWLKVAESDPGKQAERTMKYVQSAGISGAVAMTFVQAASVVEKLSAGDMGPDLLRSAAKSRTSHRLLSGEIKVRQFVQRHRRLPKTLAEAGVENDPLTGKPFRIRPYQGAWRLSSATFPELDPKDPAPKKSGS